MKLEALQSLSVTVMIVGLFLSAIGGFGAYFFSGGSERAGRASTSVQIASVEPELPVRDTPADPKLESIVEPVSEITDKQPSLIPEPNLPPIAEKPPAPAPAPVLAEATLPEKKAPEKKPATAPTAAAPEATKPAKPEPASVVAKVAQAETKPPAEVPAARTANLGLEPWQKEKLLQRLRAFPNGSIAIQVPQGNEDALGFATALKQTFLAAGWNVTGLTAVKMERDQSGLTLSSGTFPPPTDVTTVFSALASAGIKLSTELDPGQGKKPAVLFIGSRP